MWPSSIVWRQSFADICWAFLAGWLQKAPHSEIPQSFQRDTLQQTELQNIQLRSLALLFLLSPSLSFSLVVSSSHYSLSLSLFVYPLFLSHFSHFSVISLSLCNPLYGWELSSYHLQFSYCLRVIRKPFSHSQKIKNKQMRQKYKQKNALQFQKHIKHISTGYLCIYRNGIWKKKWVSGDWQTEGWLSLCWVAMTTMRWRMCRRTIYTVQGCYIPLLYILFSPVQPF